MPGSLFRRVCNEAHRQEGGAADHEYRHQPVLNGHGQHQAQRLEDLREQVQRLACRCRHEPCMMRTGRNARRPRLPPASSQTSRPRLRRHAWDRGLGRRVLDRRMDIGHGANGQARWPRRCAGTSCNRTRLPPIGRHCMLLPQQGSSKYAFLPLPSTGIDAGGMRVVPQRRCMVGIHLARLENICERLSCAIDHDPLAAIG